MYNKIHDYFIYLLIELEMIVRGVFIKNIWDLVNMNSEKYRNHVNILIKYLPKIKTQTMKEPIIRALSVKGLYQASDLLISEFIKAKDDGKETSYRWLVGNALHEIDDCSKKDEITEILKDKKYQKDG